MTTTQKQNEIARLSSRLNRLTAECPLKIKVEITAKLRALGWGRPA